MKRERILRKVKAWQEPLRYVVIQEPDYCGGHRINFFGYTKKRYEDAMEFADVYLEQNFTYILDYSAREGDVFEEHYEPLHEEPYDIPVLIRRGKAMYILK